MDCRFEEIRCPCCKAEMKQGTIIASDDVQMVKKCTDCKFWMIIVIPDEKYDYTIVKKLKK